MKLYLPKNLDFTVSKYSTWLSFELRKDINIPGYSIVPFSLFENNIKKKRILFNIYDVKTRHFNGKRLEIVTIVKPLDKITTKDDKLIQFDKNIPKIPSFIILDCYTNTMSWDPNNGITRKNAIIKFQKGNIDIKTFDKKYLRFISKSNYYQKRQITKDFGINFNERCYFPNTFNYLIASMNETEVMNQVYLMETLGLETNLYSNYISKLECAFFHPEKMSFEVSI